MFNNMQDDYEYNDDIEVENKDNNTVSISIVKSEEFGEQLSLDITKFFIDQLVTNTNTNNEKLDSNDYLAYIQNKLNIVIMSAKSTSIKYSNHPIILSVTFDDVDVDYFFRDGFYYGSSCYHYNPSLFYSALVSNYLQ